MQKSKNKQPTGYQQIKLIHFNYNTVQKGFPKLKYLFYEFNSVRKKNFKSHPY